MKKKGENNHTVRGSVVKSMSRTAHTLHPASRAQRGSRQLRDPMKKTKKIKASHKRPLARRWQEVKTSGDDKAFYRDFAFAA
jgi:hypothetical protein